MCSHSCGEGRQARRVECVVGARWDNTSDHLAPVFQFSVCLSHDLRNYVDIVQHLKLSSGWLPLASVEGENHVRREFATSNLAAPGTKIKSRGKRITAPGDL